MSDQPAAVVALPRRTIDAILIGIGAVATVVFVVAGALLWWGSNFADDYVTDELSSQRITFPAAEALEGEGRTDLLEFAGQPLETGEQAEAYASYIDGHLQQIAGGKTYAEIDDRGARAAVEEAEASGASATVSFALAGAGLHGAPGSAPATPTSPRTTAPATSVEPCIRTW